VRWRRFVERLRRDEIGQSTTLESLCRPRRMRTTMMLAQ
jgi:hypothetical protein